MKTLAAYLCTLALLSPSKDTATAAANFAIERVNALETLFVEDCQVNTEPHGFYGAFLQPCEFAFYQEIDPGTGCDGGILLEKPVPVHWFFNYTEKYDGKQWEDMSSDDYAQIQDKLMLWPDQCVGVTARCYPVHSVEAILTRLLQDKIPVGATHVQVDCRGDATALSRVIYTAAEGFEKSLPTLIAWMVTVILLFVASTMWCVYGCVYLCKGPRAVDAATRRNGRRGYVVLKDPHEETMYNQVELQKNEKL
jgi:hypothetical protein